MLDLLVKFTYLRSYDKVLEGCLSARPEQKAAEKG